MVMGYSTIRQKSGECECCGKRAPLIKKQCSNCYWLNIRLKSANKQNDREERVMDDDLSDLISQADTVFSRYVRIKAANGKDSYECFICQVPTKVTEGQNMHFVKRGNLFLRFDERNCTAGCKNCNEFKGGNYLMYVKKLEERSPGITQILMEESHLVYKPTREEIKNIIFDYTRKLKLLTK